MAGGLFGRFGGRGQHSASKSFPLTLSEEEWRTKLHPAQFRVLREHGTERAGSSPLDKQYGTGWPSFWAPLDGAVETETDRSFLMTRTEVHCSRCGSHLGHVFDDGPAPTGQRYCMNGVSLDFSPGEKPPGIGEENPHPS